MTSPPFDWDPNCACVFDMGFGESISVCFRKYVTFSGRANRAEFWWWYLFTFLLGITATLTDLALGVPLHEDGAASVACRLLTMLPTLAVMVRRLHDIDMSGWWIGAYFVVVTPFLFVVEGGPLSGGARVLVGLWALVVCCFTIVMVIASLYRGTRGPNRYGRAPS